VDIKSNGLFSAIPFTVFAVVAVSVSSLSDFAITKGLPVVVIRKFNTLVGMVGAAIFILVCGYLGSDTLKSVAFVSTSFGINGFVTGGIGPNVLDLAPSYAGVTMGVVNMISSTSGIVAPLVVKAIATAPLSEIDVLREQWREVFILAAEIYVFGAILFTVLASGEVQSWAKTTKRTPLSTANGVIGINDDIESVDHSLRVPE
jgi:ACS family sodium-dependent inorganic phosphate cotransporter-like MFS transporter 5